MTVVPKPFLLWIQALAVFLSFRCHVNGRISKNQVSHKNDQSLPGKVSRELFGFPGILEGLSFTSRVFLFGVFIVWKIEQKKSNHQKYPPHTHTHISLI